MKFLILSHLPTIYSTQRLVQEIESCGHKVTVANPENPALLSDLQGDIVIPRLGMYRYDEARANLENLQKSNHAQVVLNPLPYFHQARHKRIAHEILAELPQPKILTEVTSFPVIVKDGLSSKGRGVFLCKNQTELEECQLKLQGREVLYQEFIAESQGRDIRVFVIGQKVIACMERTSANPQEEFRSNLSLGGQGRKTTISRQEEDLCIAAVRRLKLDYAGVDLIPSHRGGLILEVNPCPGLEGIEKWSQKNIAKEIVLYAESIYHSNSHR